MALEALRKKLIDYSLNKNDKELFMKLTSPDWEKYVTVQEEAKEVKAEETENTGL